MLTRIRSLPIAFLLALLSAFMARPSFAADSLPAATQQVRIVDATGATTVQVSANNGAAIGNGITVFNAQANSTLPSYTAGRAVAPSVDLGGRTYVTGDASMTALKDNITQVGGSAVALGQTTMASSFPVVIASNQSTLPVNVSQVGGATYALGSTTSANSAPVVIASDQGAISTKVGAPSGANAVIGTQTTINSGSTTALVCKGSLAVSQPLKLYKVVVSGAAAARCTIRYNDNGSFTNWGVVMTSATDPNAIFDCNSGFCSLTTSSTVTTQQIEANCNNYDANNQDFNCSVQYCQAASGC